MNRNLLGNLPLSNDHFGSDRRIFFVMEGNSKPFWRYWPIVKNVNICFLRQLIDLFPNNRFFRVMSNQKPFLRIIAVFAFGQAYGNPFPRIPCCQFV